MRLLFRHLQVASLAALWMSCAVAQNFPIKPIRVIVPFAPGGSLDAVVRVVAQQVSESTGQPVLVDNWPGANTFIGMLACAKAPAEFASYLKADRENAARLLKSLGLKPQDASN